MTSPNFGLTDVLSRLAARPKGFYTLPELFGEDWAWGLRPRNLGKVFRQAVRQGKVPGVRWVRKRSDNRQEYEVFHPIDGTSVPVLAGPQ